MNTQGGTMSSGPSKVWVCCDAVLAWCHTKSNGWYIDQTFHHKHHRNMLHIPAICMQTRTVTETTRSYERAHEARSVGYSCMKGIYLIFGYNLIDCKIIWFALSDWKILSLSITVSSSLECILSFSPILRIGSVFNGVQRNTSLHTQVQGVGDLIIEREDATNMWLAHR